MALPIVAIVGRPNAGKSTFFNRIVKAKIAITEKVPGVTRDRIMRDTEWDNKRFTLVDTGGFTEVDDEILLQVRKQALYAVEEADVVILLLDGKIGITPEDMELNRILKEKNKKVIYAVNKIDDVSKKDMVYDFYKLSDRIIPVSAITGLGIDELMENVVSLLPDTDMEYEKDIPRIAIVGRPNTGKSTLVNSLLGKERMIVSEEPGTTRDSVDSICKYYSRRYLLIDTAGIRKKSRIEDDIEYYSVLRAMKSIERADVVLLLIDSMEGITDQDQRIAGIIDEKGKGAIVLFNKWDLVREPERRYRELMNEFNWKLWYLSYAPVCTVSGLTRKRITKIFPIIDRVISERKKRISTGELNRIFMKAKDEINIPPYRGREVKLYYLTQVETSPPGFALFVNYPDAIRDEHKRYFEKRLREKFLFYGNPIRIFIKKSE